MENNDNQCRVELVNGHYTLSEPKTVQLNDQTIQYLLGEAVLDNSCCGSTACTYAMVQGTVDGNGQLTPITDEKLQAELKQHLQQLEFVSTVNFKIPN